MKTYKVDKNNPPPFINAEYLERGKDPFHPRSYNKVLSLVDRWYFFRFFLFTKRKKGWFYINRENVEGFVPDGTVFDLEDMPTFVIFDTHPKTKNSVAFNSIDSYERFINERQD